MTDWLMVIITAIYVVATIVICYFNGKSAKAAQEQTATARKQIDEMIIQYNESNRPRIVIHFEIIRSGLLCFVVENVGPVAATDVQIRVNDAFLNNLENEVHCERLREITQMKLFMASQQRFFILLGGQPKFNTIAKEVARFDTLYFMNDQRFEEHTNIDISQYRFMLSYNSEIEDISQYLKKMYEENKKYHSSQLKLMENDKPLSVLIYNVDDSLKFKLFKAVCNEPGSNAEAIAETIECSKEEVLKGLQELDVVDGLIISDYSSDDEYKIGWYRR